jgi:hypothetical protein
MHLSKNEQTNKKKRPSELEPTDQTMISSVAILLALLVCSLADDSMPNGTASQHVTCHRQAVQFCGKITKFFDSNVSRWRDGTLAQPALSCDDPHRNVTAPVSGANCDAIFGQPFVVATVIGTAAFPDWCSSPERCEDSGANQPVVVCHEAHVDASSCCCDFGQYHAADFIGKCPESMPRETRHSVLEPLTHVAHVGQRDTVFHLGIVLGTRYCGVYCSIRSNCDCCVHSLCVTAARSLERRGDGG